MDIKELDVILKKSGVKFLPYVGDNYEFGVDIKDGELLFGSSEHPKKKLLILGESHYIEDYDPNVDICGFTRDVIKDFCDENYSARWMNTFIKFSRAIYGRETTKEEDKRLFNSTIFYNYLQVPLTGPRTRGNDEDYIEAQSTLFSLLDTVKPDVMIVWGYRLWEYLPDDHGFSWAKTFINANDIFKSAKYTLGTGHLVEVIPIHHPSAAFDWTFWQKVISNLF